MSADVEAIVSRIAAVSPLFHNAGPLSPKVIKAIYRHSKSREIHCSLETGSGVSTLLLSHLSERHIVFAMDEGSGSIENVLRSSLLNRPAVQFVEGPTQITLPQFRFPDAVQFALLDGPHAYSFPDLEYFYIYPLLDRGALLVIDDIHIKTVHHLFSFLKADSMFRLDEVVGTTAFFSRTAAPTFAPHGDGWASQFYNRAVLRRYDWARQARELLPLRTRRFLTSLQQSKCKILIDHPKEGSVVDRMHDVSGRVESDNNNCFLWVLIRRKDIPGWWPQACGCVSSIEGRWHCRAEFGDAENENNEFEIAAVLANLAIHDYVQHWQADAAKTSPVAPIKDFPFRSGCCATAYRTVSKNLPRLPPSRP